MGYKNINNIALPKKSIDLSAEITLNENLINSIFDNKKSSKNLISFYALTEEILCLLNTLSERDISFSIFEQSKDSAIVKYLDSKKGFREVLSDLSKENSSIGLPQGSIAYDIDTIVKRIWKFFEQKKNCVLKASFGESGWGIHQFKYEDYLTLEKLSQEVKQVLSSDSIWNFPEYIIEELIDIDNTISGGSPSVELFVSDSGVTITYSCEQVVNSKGEFFGVGVGLNTVEDKLEEKLFEISKVIGERYKKLGYRGYFDIDFVISKAGQMYPVETNMRRTGGTHVYDIGKQLFGNDKSNWGYLLSNDSLKFNKKYSNTSLVLQKAHDFLYNGETKKTGVIITLINLEDSILGYVVVADNKENALLLQDEFTKVLNT